MSWSRELFNLSSAGDRGAAEALPRRSKEHDNRIMRALRTVGDGIISSVGAKTGAYAQ